MPMGVHNCWGEGRANIGVLLSGASARDQRMIPPRSIGNYPNNWPLASCAVRSSSSLVTLIAVP